MAVCRVCGVQTEFGHAATRAFKRADHFICQLALRTMGCQTITDDAAGGVKCNGCRLIIDQVLSRLQSAPVGASSWSLLKKMRTAKTHHDGGAVMVSRSDLSALVSMGAGAFTLAFNSFPRRGRGKRPRCRTTESGGGAQYTVRVQSGGRSDCRRRHHARGQWHGLFTWRAWDGRYSARGSMGLFEIGNAF